MMIDRWMDRQIYGQIDRKINMHIPIFTNNQHTRRHWPILKPTPTLTSTSVPTHSKSTHNIEGRMT